MQYGSFVKAAQAYFSAEPHGKKIEILEFKALTTEDKIELSEMLNAEGFTHEPYTGPAAEAA
jgi:hypothetical protein